MADAPEVVLTKTLIPTDLHDRGWAKPFLEKPWSPETAGEVFKKLEGAESLLGKKTLIPDDKSDPKDVEAFYSKLGLEKPEGYDVKGLGEKPDEVFSKEVQAAAHKGRLTQKQLSDFLGDLGPKVAARQKAVAEAQAARDAEFEAIVKTTFGADNAKVLARATELLKEHTPENLRPFIDKLDNNALAILTGITDSFARKYMSEDELRAKDGKGGAGGATKEALSAEAIKLQSSPAFKDFQHPEYAATQKRIAEIYADPVFK